MYHSATISSMVRDTNMSNRATTIEKNMRRRRFRIRIMKESKPSKVREIFHTRSRSTISLSRQTTIFKNKLQNSHTIMWRKKDKKSLGKERRKENTIKKNLNKIWFKVDNLKWPRVFKKKMMSFWLVILTGNLWETTSKKTISSAKST